MLIEVDMFAACEKIEGSQHNIFTAHVMAYAEKAPPETKAHYHVQDTEHVWRVLEALAVSCPSPCERR